MVITFAQLFFFNDTATTEIYTLSLHDALPIFHGVRGPLRLRQDHDAAHDRRPGGDFLRGDPDRAAAGQRSGAHGPRHRRSEEHTSELQSRQYLVCRLLLEKKKTLLSKRYQLTD